jgi:signal peptidase I
MATISILGCDGQLPMLPSATAPPVRRKMLRIARRLLVLALIALAVKIFIGEAALVPTPSMEGTVLVGDHLLLNKAAYGPEIPFSHLRLPRLARIQRGDIIAFHYPKDPTQNFLKRVVAIGGDTVQIRRGILYINGLPTPEPYVVHRAHWRSAEEENMPPVPVPAGHLFVLGDNRDNSDDSRFWGTVPEQNVIGEPLLVYWSYDAPSSRWLEENPTRKLAFYSSIVVHIFGKTRWARTGTILE